MGTSVQRHRYKGGVFDDQFLYSPVDLEMARLRRRYLTIFVVVAAGIAAACWYVFSGACCA